MPDALPRLGVRVPRLPVTEWACLAAAVMLPLACNPWGGSGFELPKAALLRLLVLVLVVFTLRDALATRAPRPETPPHGDDGSSAVASEPAASARPPMGERHVLIGAALAYLVALVLATAFSTDRLVSLFGSHARQQGLLTQAGYVLLFLLATFALRAREQADRLWRAMVWASAPVAAYGLAQALGVDPLGWQSDGNAALSTLGRSNFLGGYLVQAMALTVGLALAGRRLYVSLMLVQAACLAATQARAALCGLVVVVVVFAAGMVPRRQRRVALAATVFAALLVAVPVADRATIASAGGSVAARLTIWRLSWQLLAERPLLGYGPDAVQPGFNRVFAPELVFYQGRGVMVDRAHNLWLDLGLSAGLLGAATYAAVIVAAVVLAVRCAVLCGDRAERLACLALLAAILGHVAEQQFSFALTGSATTLWLTLALLAAVAYPRPPPATTPTPPPVAAPTPELTPATTTTTAPAATTSKAPLLRRAAWLPPSFAASLLAILTAVLPLTADTLAGMATSFDAPLTRREGWAALATRLWPIEPEYRLRHGLLLAETGDTGAAQRQIAAAIALRPQDPRAWLVQAAIHAAAATDAAGPSLAETSYRRAISLAPNVATTHVALGMLLANEGRLSEAIGALEQAVALDTTDYNAHALLAAVYAGAGLVAQAEKARGDAAYWQARMDTLAATN